MKTFLVRYCMFFLLLYSCYGNNKLYEFKENFQLIYCSEYDPIYSYYKIHFNNKNYEPFLKLTYKNSLLDSLYYLHPEGYLGYSIDDLNTDSLFFCDIKKEYKIDMKKNVYLNNNIIRDNGNLIEVEKINQKYFYIIGKMLVIYLFTQ